MHPALRVPSSGNQVDGLSHLGSGKSRTSNPLAEPMLPCSEWHLTSVCLIVMLLWVTRGLFHTVWLHPWTLVIATLESGVLIGAFLFSWVLCSNFLSWSCLQVLLQSSAQWTVGMWQFLLLFNSTCSFKWIWSPLCGMDSHLWPEWYIANLLSFGTDSDLSVGIGFHLSGFSCSFHSCWCSSTSAALWSQIACIQWGCITLILQSSQIHGCFCLAVLLWVIWDMRSRSMCVVEFPPALQPRHLALRVFCISVSSLRSDLWMLLPGSCALSYLGHAVSLHMCCGVSLCTSASPTCSQCISVSLHYVFMDSSA